MATAPLPPLSEPVLASEAAPLSEGARIVNTFIAPSKTFGDLRRNASWWGPWLLISIVSLLFVYSMDRQIGFDLYGMASALVIWTIVLLGIGFSANSKVKRTTAIVIVAAWYLFWKLGVAALAARS
ncbi:MAG TPA: hypothetical protein VFF50_11830 [Candidatus Deferrimicrobiaceae bacterium]|jgi:hypothetical protein|nr:hypothetical protein [Candidatus Deferrimicrobiaceae bacterium]